MKEVDYNALGSCLNSSWGKASTHKTSSFSVKGNLVADRRLRLVYSAIVNLTTDKDAVLMKRHYTEESDQIVKDAVKRIKAEYKEITGEAISFDELSSETGLEMINYNHINAKKQAYFRRIVFLEVK